MGKWVNDIVLDTPLTFVKDNAILLTVCTAEPTSYTEATELYMIGQIPMIPADYTIADGDESGRKLIVSTKIGVVANPGRSNHIALCSDSLVLYVDTCAPKDFVTNTPIVVNSWKIEWADPS